MPGYECFNAVQEEICAVVEAAGIALDESDRTQLVAALIKTGMQGSHFSIANAGGTADAITAVFSPAIAALTHGMTLQVRAAAANATTAPTFTPAVGTIAAKTIVKGNNLPLAVGDIAGAGHWLTVCYDQTLDKFVLQNPAKGIIEGGMSVGAHAYFPSTTPPPGWLKRNGALLSRTAYPALYAFAVSSGNIVAEGQWQAGMFSYGDGATTFRIPDGRGEFERGWDDARGVDSGRAIGSWQNSDNKSHTHNFRGGNAATGGVIFNAQYGAGGPGYTIEATGSIVSNGGEEARPRNTAHLACIKY